MNVKALYHLREAIHHAKQAKENVPKSTWQGSPNMLLTDIVKKLGKAVTEVCKQ